MSMRYGNLSASRLEPAQQILRAAVHSWNKPVSKETAQRRSRVFVTVSRQFGAGAISFSHRLAARLNALGTDDWSAWDRELVEKVSSEHGISQEILEMIANRRHNWVDELLRGFMIGQIPPEVEELRAYKQMMMAIRALATAGHAIIVGQGGTFITRGMPAAIHLRLVAPVEHRTRSIAARESISLHEAAARIADSDQRRAEFYRRYWPGTVIAPETFTMTLNSGELSVDELVECVIPLIRIREVSAND